jgi:hypothetical protein
MSKFIRRLSGKKGMEALQAVILLGAAFLIVIGVQKFGNTAVSTVGSLCSSILGGGGGGEGEGEGAKE